MEKTNITFTDATGQWLESIQLHISRATYYKYEQLIRNYIAPFFDAVSFEALDTGILNQYYQETCVNEPTDGHRLSEGNLRTILMIVNKTLEFAYDNRYTEIRQYIKPCIAKTPHIVQVFTTEHQQRLERHLFSQHNKYSLAMMTALYTGVRIGELCALKWSDVDLISGALNIRRTVQRLKTGDLAPMPKTVLMISPPKSRSSYRSIPLPGFVREYMLTFYNASQHEYYIFTDSGDHPLDPRTLQYAYKRVLKSHDIPYMNFHCLRHTFATRCITLGWDVKTLSEILGHADIKMTMDYYFHSSFEYKKMQMDKLTPLGGQAQA